MRITLASVRARPSRGEGWEALVEDYVERSSRYAACELRGFEMTAGLLDWVEKQAGRTAACLILLDVRGQSWSSEEFAGHLGRLRDVGTQHVVLGIGPPNGWSDGELRRAHLLFSLGRITLPHQLARVVLAEQVYRALTILAGHPYHCGH